MHNFYKMRLLLFSRPVTSSPYNRIPSDKWLPMDTKFQFISETFIILFATIFFSAWNFHFPTEAERIIWRAATIYNLVFCTFGAWYMYLWIRYLLPRHEQRKKLANRTTRTRSIPPQPFRVSLDKFLDNLRNSSPNKDPLLEIPLSFLLSISVLCFLYCICRTYILLEDCIGLRSLPASAYITVEWSEYIPHL
jgi:hypothetical protein